VSRSNDSSHGLLGRDAAYHVTTRRHNPEDYDLNLDHRENLKSRLDC
jgi:hypothetical protein